MKLLIPLLYGPAILLDMTQKWMKYVHTNTCVWIFMEPLFTAPPNQNFISRWINKQSILTFILLNNKKEKADTTWSQKYTELKKSDIKKYIVHLFHLHKILEQIKFIYTDSKSPLLRSKGRSHTTKELRQCSEVRWEIKCNLSCSSLLCTYSKTHQATPSKWLCFMVCKLYFNSIGFKGKKILTFFF